MVRIPKSADAQNVGSYGNEANGQTYPGANSGTDPNQGSQEGQNHVGKGASNAGNYHRRAEHARVTVVGGGSERVTHLVLWLRRLIRYVRNCGAGNL